MGNTNETQNGNDAPSPKPQQSSIVHDARHDEPDSKLSDDERVSIRIAPVSTTSDEKNVQNIVFELTAPPKKRTAVDVCAVIDVSYSMDSPTFVREDDGTIKNDDGFNVLDLVKHSFKTVMHCLGANDRVSIVSFGSCATIEQPLINMTEEGRAQAVTALEALQPKGLTKLWEGLKTAMDSLRNKQEQGRLSVIMVLTDGQPTDAPDEGYIPALQKYITSTGFEPQINAFGFGYKLDSELLHDLAVAGNGTFAFIPDALIVGTTFVHSVSNVLTTISAKTTLNLTPMNGAKFVGQSWGLHREQDTSRGRYIEFGPITCGGTRYLSVPMKLPKNQNKPYLKCTLVTAESKQTTVANDRKIAPDLLAAHLTAKTVSITMGAANLTDALKNVDEALMLLETLKNEVKAAADIAAKSETDDFNEMTANSRMEALNKDVQGRLNKSFQGWARFNRWGKHYIRALLRAHQVNVCTNFMDPGLQINGGDLFQELRAKGDEVFVNLPAPIPSDPPRNKKQTKNANQNANVNMNTYYGGAGGGCFASYCTVQVMDMCHKQSVTTRVCDVRPGDMVKVADGFATVRFVIELARDARRRMVKFAGGLVITGGHPIRRNGVWCKPKEQNDGQITHGCPIVYAFVLDQSHILLVNGVQCITWCHQMKDEIVKDELYGTQKIIEALQRKSIKADKTFGGRDTRAANRSHLENVISVFGK